jgi:hypothetical protein
MNEIIQRDEFAQDAEVMRSFVISNGFTSETGPDGAVYTGISKHQAVQWFELISGLRGEKIIPRLSCFRMNLAGELPHSWVHSDDICAKYASVLYLNHLEQCKGGTAFWRHKELDIDRLPQPEYLKSIGVDPEGFYREMNDDWKRLEKWDQTGMVEMKWNRFITYPTCLFHSRFPFEGFGSGPQDGRLIWICFYDLEKA